VTIADELMTTVKALGLNEQDTVGLGFDGAGNMAGKSMHNIPIALIFATSFDHWLLPQGSTNGAQG
jgi:hypothetical protein